MDGTKYDGYFGERRKKVKVKKENIKGINNNAKFIMQNNRKIICKISMQNNNVILITVK